MPAPDHRTIMGAMDQYFDGLYRADPSTLGSIFHDALRYVNATRGGYVAKNLVAYLDEVASRVAPDQAGDRRNPKVLQIVPVSDSVIFVHASMSMMGRDYQDALIFIDSDDGWKIVAKVFSHMTIGEG
jgi:hypothetical protein